YWTFTERILAGRPIKVFNNGDLLRDFTYIDDIVDGVVATATGPFVSRGPVPHRLYNIGDNRPTRLLRFIEILEDAIGVKAEKEFLPMQPGDVPVTAADIGAIAADFGFAPEIPLEDGIPRFVRWYREHHSVAL
ncbi:MAG: NAD-dependent epimerase/dehydratase family protein, partial [Parvularculaceae bacterium]|nr:NAD-dependent epimerase/dehydratase family protein [Parvularculaceae bacterium]